MTNEQRVTVGDVIDLLDYNQCSVSCSIGRYDVVTIHQPWKRIGLAFIKPI